MSWAQAASLIVPFQKTVPRGACTKKRRAHSSPMAGTDEERIAREGTNNIVEVVPSDHRYSILRRSDGQFLASSSEGLSFGAKVGDDAVWDAAPGGFKHPLTGAVVRTDEEVDGARFVAEWGPESLPSQYLESLIQNGHVCMPALLAPELCVELQQLAEEPNTQPMVLRAAAGIKVSTHPVAMWVIRSCEYCRNGSVAFESQRVPFLPCPESPPPCSDLRVDYKLAHSPGFAILPAGQGIGNQGGWVRVTRQPTRRLQRTVSRSA